MGVSVAADHIAAKEAAIIRIARAGDKKEAVRKLFILIADCAADKDFQNAERLQERLHEIAPTALKAIIRSTEIIEQAKTGVVRQGYLNIWSDLLNELSPREFSAIYHELENRALQPEEVLIKLGAENNELFFINHGSIKVSYKQNDHEIFIKSLTGGEIAGENFFDASVWTVSLRALTPCQISILKRSSFIRWQEEFPGLKDKLKAFCSRSNNIHNLLDKKGLSRRTFERYQISRKVQVQMTDETGKPIGQEFTGELFNISRGGLALRIRLASEENGRLLLSKKMQVSIPVGGKQSQIQIPGQVLSAHPFTSKANDFLVHFCCSEELNQKTLQAVLGITPQIPASQL